jgi:hypothetical protein
MIINSHPSYVVSYILPPPRRPGEKTVREVVEELRIPPAPRALDELQKRPLIEAAGLIFGAGVWAALILIILWRLL